MPEEQTYQLSPLTTYQMRLLIMGLRANARNLTEYGPQARIPDAEIQRQNHESRKLEAVLINRLPYDDRP